MFNPSAAQVSELINVKKKKTIPQCVVRGKEESIGRAQMIHRAWETTLFGTIMGGTYFYTFVKMHSMNKTKSEP